VSKEYSTLEVLELACAAQRWNKEYLKEMTAVYEDNGQLRYYKQPNKLHILYTLGAVNWGSESDPRMMPVKLQIEDIDREEAEEIRKYYRRLMFAAVKGDNEFQTEVNAILSAEVVAANKVGYVACLPHVYAKDHVRNQIEKRIRHLEKGYLADVGKTVFDKDCEVLESKHSNNFDAFNITAIIDNKMVSWFSKVDLKLGACVIVKAKVKDHSNHWKHKDTAVTRLNYVKAAQ
jgi:hypothetical protein